MVSWRDFVSRSEAGRITLIVPARYTLEIPEDLRALVVWILKALFLSQFLVVPWRDDHRAFLDLPEVYDYSPIWDPPGGDSLDTSFGLLRLFGQLLLTIIVMVGWFLFTKGYEADRAS